MTNQEIFNKVAKHLLKQNARSVDPNDEICCYRGPDGLQCAVGCLIADEHYSPELEGLPVDTYRVRGALYASGIVEVHPDSPLYTGDAAVLLAELQVIHDNDGPAYWRQALRMTAESFGLDAAVLDEVAT